MTHIADPRRKRYGKLKAYKNPKGAVVGAWRPAHWANWMFEVDSWDSASKTLGWTKGGFQGARGDDKGGEWCVNVSVLRYTSGSNPVALQLHAVGTSASELIDFCRYIENVFEELDNENEFFYDRETSKLYYIHNGTGAPSRDTLFEATVNHTIVSLKGSQLKPVVNVKFQGITFRDAAYTYMEPHGVPSGGSLPLAQRFTPHALQAPVSR